MMDKTERELALTQMQLASDEFYKKACHIGNHPFIEFTGLLNEYIKICREAHENDIDFSDCNTHTQQHLPIMPHELNYINEKLECIFTGRVVL